MSSETKAFERWNTHFSTCVEQEVLGVNLRLAQDPNSEHLGTTVWDASIVLAKFFEKNIRKGDFSRPKVTGKRAIELGAGMGLAGLAFAMIGANVVLTDVKEVLPLLQRNYENNISAAALRAAGNESHLSSCGRVTVAELDWSKPEHYAHLTPPTFDFVLAADCIYHETLLRQLYRVVLAVTNARSTVIIANERRSESVQAAFTSLFSDSFTFKKVPLAKQDPEYSHPVIEMYILKKKKGATDASLCELEAKEAADMAEVAASMQQLAASPPAPAIEHHQQQQLQDQQQQQEQSQLLQQIEQPEERQQQQQDHGQCRDSSNPNGVDTAVDDAAAAVSQAEQDQQDQQQPSTVAGVGNSSQQPEYGQQLPWQTRRAGAQAARLLVDLQVPNTH